MTVRIDSGDPSDDVEVYTKADVDGLLADLPGGENTYTKTEVDDKFAALPVAADGYTRQEVDDKFAALPVPAVTYTKEEVDNKIAAAISAIPSGLTPATVDAQITAAITGLVRKPVTRADLATDVQASLAKADTATQPATTPSPTPKPYIATMADVDFAFAPLPVNTPNSVFQEITTPSGPGFKISCSDAEVAPWNEGTSRAVLAKKQAPAPVAGTTEDWKFNILLPTQPLSNDWQAGVLWEYHTATSSGHHLALNSDGTFRIVRMISTGQNYTFVGPGSAGPPVLWNQWQPVRFQIKWSTGSSGFMRVWINNTQHMNFSGQTLWASEGDPALQFGFYGVRPRGITNIVQFGNIQRTVT